ncbi:LPS export ABC transporter permease LptG [Nitratireductor sp. ZSWI3]|uniref:LPS export ABC transporter permease LptG n=1 Tax=Nitratireductor sp. ZSWI3 TaxID=2966359 RepID=UPI0021503F93|nr:LPS export ABC transporter permease LptG [Nitratireductor sp. ZSWI3]MCR4269195.1 LPS export ABC transporter permease LptG [Nitratireductor sp. ZSWI3]
MIGYTLGSYFFRRYASITAWNFVGIGILIFIVTFAEVSSRSAGLPGYSTQWALSLAALQTPIILLQAVPFIGLIAAMATLISLNRKYELVVARAAGVSAWQFLTPIAFGSFVFGVLAVGLLNPLAAHGFSRAQSLETEVRGAKTTANSEAEQWIKQRSGDEETVIGASAVLNGGQVLVRPTFFRIDSEGRIAERLDAERAFLRDGFWELTTVARRRGTAAAEHLVSVQVPTNLRAEFVGEQLTRPEATSIYALPGKIEVAHSFGLRANAFATHFHSLVVLPVLLVAMTLIAATVSMRFTRMGQSATVILGGVLAGFLLYVVSVLVKAFGSAGVVPPVVAAWTPVVVAMFYGVTFLLYKEDG